jgi:hypothetical protein
MDPHPKSEKRKALLASVEEKAETCFTRKLILFARTEDGQSRGARLMIHGMQESMVQMETNNDIY